MRLRVLPRARVFQCAALQFTLLCLAAASGVTEPGQPGAPALAGMTNYVPPADSNWIHAVDDIGLVGDGKTDNTAALERYRLTIKNPHDAGTYYFPDGVYLFSDTFVLGNKRLVLHGQSRDGVILRLRRNSEGFNNSAQPKPFVSFYEKFMNPKSAFGQAFKNSIFNMTIEVEEGNPGAVALHYFNNNQGTVENVTLRSKARDGAGRAGLGLVTNWPGPAYIKNLVVEGFDYGIWSTIGQYSITLEDIVLKGQREYGILNSGQALFIRHLLSENKVTALKNTEPTTNIVLLDSTLQGGAPENTAIESWQTKENTRWKEGEITPGLFVRNVVTNGYGTALVSKGSGETRQEAGPRIQEFTSRKPAKLFSTASASQNLPFEDAPTVDLGNSADWVNLRKFQPATATVDGKAVENWSPALQAAIDAGAKVIYLPKASYPCLEPVILRGNVQAIMGMDSTLNTEGWAHPGKPLLQVVDNGQPVLLLDRLNDNYGKADPLIQIAARKTVTVKSIMGARIRNTVPGGKLFIYDVVGENMEFNGLNVWARQLNVESKPDDDGRGFHVRQTGGTMVVLGIKTEYGRPVLEARKGALTEILGGWSYHDGKSYGYLDEDSKVTLAGVSTSHGFFAAGLVKEVNNGQAKLLNIPIGRDGKHHEGNYRPYGTLLPLYLGE